MFLVNDKLCVDLTSCLEQIVNETQSPLVFGHICWGMLSKPGALRKSQIVDNGDPNIPLSDIKGTSLLTHEDAFRNHIIRFERSVTLLDWLSIWMYGNLGFSQPREPHTSACIKFLINNENNAPPLNFQDNTFTISARIYKELSANEDVLEYMKRLYLEEPHDENEYDQYLQMNRFAAEKLVGCRFHASMMIRKDPHSTLHLKGMSSYYGQYGELTGYSNYFDWMFLGALQTGHMYVNNSTIAGKSSYGFVSIGTCYNVFSDKHIKDNPLLLISVVIPENHKTRDDINRIVTERILAKTAIETTIREIGHYRELPSKQSVLEFVMPKWDPMKISRAISDQIIRTMESHSFPGWASAIILWLSLATERLRDNIHEGKTLGFCFAIADESQIKDSGLFDIVDLGLREDVNIEDRNNDGIIVPWDRGGNHPQEREVSECLERIDRLIGKMNYAWFQDGKYALLWDATFPRRFPKSLIRFKDSSWDVFIRNIRIGRKGKAARVVLALAYVGADGNGGVIIKGKQILTFRKSRPWDTDAGERPAELKTHIMRAIQNWQIADKDRLAEFVTDILLAIADDPSNGCMLIVFAGNTLPPFSDMGEPLVRRENIFEYSKDELMALMSMDGATCLYTANDVPKIMFRRLVEVPENPTRTINGEHAKRFLAGEGSRKWSGAKASTRADVKLVISVSQDGPIFVFHPSSENENSVEINRLTAD